MILEIVFNIRKVVISVLTIITLFFFGCQKDEPQENVSIIGKKWKLHSGKVYITNLDNGRKAYYDHLGQNMVFGNLNPFSPSYLPIDNISTQTTWEFNDTHFILNDTLSYRYSVSYSINQSGNFRVYGLENGSARPIEVFKSTNTQLTVKMYSSNGNDGKDNYSFYSILTFTLSNQNSTPEIWPNPPGYTYGGIIGININPSPTLTGTKWVVVKYSRDLITTFPHDTIHFINNSDYTIGSSTNRTYNLSSIIGSNMKSLSLYQFTTLGGDWTGEVQSTFINDRIINNATFYNLFSSQTAIVWMERIQ